MWQDSMLTRERMHRWPERGMRGSLGSKDDFRIIIKKFKLYII